MAQAVKPAEPRFVSAFLLFFREILPDPQPLASAILRPADIRRHANLANHVHLLVWPRVSPSRFLQTLKGYTAREANRLLGRTGQPFWQAESYDHSVRDDRESDRIKAYIENNPVKGGLVASAEDYLWSSAARKAEMNLGSAGSTARATDLK